MVALLYHDAFIFISERYKYFGLHGGTVNNCRAGKNMVSLSPLVFITGLMHTHAKVHVSAGPQGRRTQLRNRANE